MKLKYDMGKVLKKKCPIVLLLKIEQDDKMK